ncbi:MAG: SEL1-like repeat protein [Rhodospirillales bacterium]|nr:SEL1-like repeat protein [Rhodospirillales bacterium]
MLGMRRHSLFCMIALLALAPLTAGVCAEPPAEGDKVGHVPVPFYSSHVVETKKVAAGMVVIETTDSTNQVIDWYRANLKDQIADLNVDAAHHHFLTHNGSGVGVSSDSARSTSGTKIELLWDAAKYGDYKPLPPPNTPETDASSKSPKNDKEAGTAPSSNGEQDASVALQPKGGPKASVVAPPPKDEREASIAPAPKDEPKASVAPPPKGEQEASIAPQFKFEPKAVIVPAPKDKPKASVAPPLNAPPRAETDSGGSTGSKPAGPAKSASGTTGLNYFRAGQYAEALENWQAGALAGDATAALYLGMMYDTGQGVTQSSNDALNWYRAAADEGNPVGSFNVGVMYDAGLGVDHNPSEASRWYANAAEMGHGQAAYVLALIYETGAGLPQDLAQANHYFRLAAELGIAAARDHLDKSDQIRPRKVQAPDVSAQSFQAAQKAAPVQGSRGAAAAARRFSRAADNGNASAEYDLAYCYETGIGVPVDLQQAYAMYKEAGDTASDEATRSAAKVSAARIEGRFRRGGHDKLPSVVDSVRP